MTSVVRRIGAPNLASAHQTELLDGSGITLDVAQRAGLRSCSDPQEIVRLLNWTGRNPERGWTWEYLPALIIPYRTPGEAEPVIYRIKPRKPWPKKPGAGTDQKDAKYLQPRGAGVRLYFPPDLLEDETRRRDTAVPLLVTEGEKKALAACSQGLACVGLSGVSCWSAKAKRDGIRRRLGARKLHADFEHIELSGRQVFVIFDSDAADKPQVRSEESVLARALHEAGAVVHVVRLPPAPEGQKQGLDDFLVASGPAALEKLLSASEQWKPQHAGDDGRRVVVIRGDIEDRKRTVLAALAETNDPPWLFQSANGLVDVHGEPGQARIRLLGERELRAQTTDRLRFVAEKQGKGGSITQVLTDLSLDVYRHILAQPTWDLPRLDTVLRNPAFAPDGSLIDRDGYYPDLATWTDLGGFVVPAVPENPTQGDLDRARSLLIHEMLGDFPFADQGSLAHAVALALLPFVRPMIAGCTPLHLVSAPTTRTGKSLLANSLCIVATGAEPEIMTECRWEEDWKKEILAALLASPTAVMIDNLESRLSAAVLNTVLTCRTWTGRLLGLSRNARVSTDAVWVATGNNPALSDEIAGKTIEIRLDARVDRPEERTGFRHELPDWALEARGELAWACLVLIQHWIALGQPAGPYTLGSYARWAATLGGILDAAGIEGLLSNRDGTRRNADADTGEWLAFVEVWWQSFGGRAVKVSELRGLARESELLASVLGDGNDQSQLIRFGRALKGRVDRTMGGHVLRLGSPDGRAKVNTYYLHPRDGDEAESSSSLVTSAVADWRAPEVDSQECAGSGSDSPHTPRTLPAAEGIDTKGFAGSAGSCGELFLPPHMRARMRAHAHTGECGADSPQLPALPEHPHETYLSGRGELSRKSIRLPADSPHVDDVDCEVF